MAGHGAIVRNPTAPTKRHKLHEPHETHAMRIVDEMIRENRVFDNCQRTQDLDQAGVDVVLIKDFPRGFQNNSKHIREFRLFVQFKSNEEDAISFTQSNPCVISWTVNTDKPALVAKIELLRAIVDWLVLHRNQYAIDFFRNHLLRYEATVVPAS